MAIVIKPITLEVSKPNVFQAIAAKQGDSNSRFIKATIANDGVMIPVLPTSTVTINAKRVDGQSESFFGEANEDGTATVPIHSWMLELVGYVNCDVSIIDIEGRKLTTTSFTLFVEEASHNSDDVSEEEQYDFIAALSEEVMSRIASKAEQSEVDEIQEEIAEINEKISNFDGGGSTVTNTASGEAIALTDISPIEHTMGVKARSKNILPFPYQEPNLKNNQATHKGITFTVNDDKSITISGVNDGTGTSYLRLVRNASMKVNSCILSGGISSKCYIRATNTEDVRYGDDNGNGLYVDNVELSSIVLMISSGSDYTTPVTVYPMLEEGTAKTNYTPPVDVSTASVKQFGKNLIPFPYPEMNRTYAGVTYKANNDGSIFTSGGTSSGQSWFTLGSNLKFPAGKYILSGCPPGSDGNSYRLYLLRNGSYDFSDDGLGNGAIVTLTGDESVTIRLTIYANKNVDGLVSYPMLRMAGTDGTYEPPTEPIINTPNADGTVEGVTSIYPTTTLIADSGVVLDVEYNADTKKYIDNKFAELAAMIVNS